LSPLAWLLATFTAVVLIAVVGSRFASHRSPVPRWAWTATIIASPVAYVVLLRRCEASWAKVTSNLGILIGEAAALTIFLSVVVSNLLGTVDRGKQKRTMHDIRVIASAIEAYGATHPGGAHAVSTEELRAVLGSQLPQEDAWSNPILVDWEGPHYRLRSLGRDGELDQGTSASTDRPVATQRFDDDIVFVDGRFTRYPAGSQE
jgi:type II secretory pathway pseudopilin PulG